MVSPQPPRAVGSSGRASTSFPMIHHLLAAALAVNVPFEAEVPAYNAKASSWVASTPPLGEELMTLTAMLAVEPSAKSSLEATFWAVSDPKNARYGQHLSQAQLKTLLAVPEARTERVRAFFSSLSTSATAMPNKYGDSITLTLPVADVERALTTSIGAFTHTERPDVRILRATSGYSLPAAIAADVQMVGELLQFPALRSRSLVDYGASSGSGSWPNACDGTSKAATCKGKVTPAVLGARYKVPVNDSTKLMGTMAVGEQPPFERLALERGRLAWPT